MAEAVTLARPYAKAIFEVALAGGDLATWQKALDAAAAVTAFPKIKEALAAPSLTSVQQSAIVLDICAGELNEGVANLLRLLAENKRLTLMPEIARQFAELKAEREKTLEVNVTSAFPLEDAVAQRLAEALGKKWACQVKLAANVDKSLLGGVIIRAGDTVIDASVRGRLEKLAEVITQ